MRAFLFALVIIVFLDTFVQFPIISPYAEQLGATSMVIGLVVGMYSATNLVGNVLAGKWIDQFGAKNILILGMATSVVALYFYTFVTNPVQLVLARSLHGFTGGLLAPSIFTVIARQGGNARQGRNMAFSGAAVGLAAVIGPALGGIINARLGINHVFIIVGVLMLVGMIASLKVIPAALPKKPTQDMSSDDHQASGGWGSLLRNQSMLLACLGAFGLMFTMGVLTYMLPLKTQALMFSDQSAGFMLSTFGIVAVLFFVLPINKYYDIIPAKLILTNGFAVIAIALIMLSLFQQEAALYGALAVFGIGFALVFPSMNALLAEGVPEADRGKGFGIFYAVYSIGVVVGSFTIGAVDATPDGGFLLASCIVATFALIMVVIRIVEVSRKTV